MATWDRIEFAADVVAAFISHNSVPVAEVPNLIESVHAAFAGGVVAQDRTDRLTPVVSIRKSITPDYLICLDDGKRYKSLRRHLARLGMTPEQYRAKWGLPLTYPMVAANYAAKRSELAKGLGLGRRRTQTAAPASPAKARRKVGRPRKVAQ